MVRLNHFKNIAFHPYLTCLHYTAKSFAENSSSCSYEWCQQIPKIEVSQFMVGFLVATIGYTFCLSLSGSIYSKVIGTCNAVRDRMLDHHSNKQKREFHLISNLFFCSRAFGLAYLRLLGVLLGCLGPFL